MRRRSAANYANGTHTVNVRITDVTGCSYFLEPRTVRVDNARNQPPFGNVDLPLPDSSVGDTGVIHIAGWALDDRRINHVEVYVDDLQERQAVTGIHRADVAAYYPDTTASIIAGFVANLDSTRLTNGVHHIRVMAVDDQGQKGLLGVRRIQVFNNSANLAPFGVVEFPLLNATWFGNCFDPVGGPSGGDIVDPRFLMFVTGWALDTSVQTERGGLSHVYLEIDGVTIKDTRINCHREFLLNNQPIDCYGYYRPDVEVIYPGFQQAPNAGFHFAVDVGYLLTQKGFREGGHILQVKAADKEDQIRLLREIPITMECATGNLDPSPLGFVDDPYNYKFVNGIFPVLGWALDLDNVVQVRVLIDGVRQIDAVRNVDYAEFGLASPDVAAVYPAYPQRSNARWRFYLDTTKISNSEHDLLVEVLDGRGNFLGRYAAPRRQQQPRPVRARKTRLRNGLRPRESGADSFSGRPAAGGLARRPRPGCGRPRRGYGRPAWRRLLLATVAEEPPAQDVGDLAQHGVGVLAEVVRHVEEHLDREVVQEDAAREHDGRERRDARLELLLELQRRVLGEEGLEALGHARVKLADVLAVELHDVDVDECDVRPVPRDALARGQAQRLEVVGEGARGQRGVHGVVGAGDGLPVLVEERAEQGLLVGVVVVDAARGDSRGLGDVAHARRPVALMREERERRALDRAPRPAGSLVLLHGGEATRDGNPRQRGRRISSQ
jgi:hypothetical protein